MTDTLFSHAGSFEQGEISGNVRLGKFEAQYEELFAVAYEDGIITPEERAQLDKAADALGLDRERVLSLERALSAAWHARHGRAAQPAEIPAMSLRPLELENDPQVKALRK